MKVKVFKDFEDISKIPEDSIVIVSKDFDILKEHEKHPLEAGIDLYCTQDVTLSKFEIKIIPTGVKVKTPPGIYTAILPRSSTPLNYKILIPNSMGVIDPTYRGEMGIISLALTDLSIQRGSKLAQMIFHINIPVANTWVYPLGLTELHIFYYLSDDIFNNFEKYFPSYRGNKGFGSTGNRYEL